MTKAKDRPFGYWGPPGKFVWWSDGSTYDIEKMGSVHIQNAISAITCSKMLKRDHDKVAELREELCKRGQ